MNGNEPRNGKSQKRAAIAVAICLAASFGVTLACWGAATQLSDQYASGFSINLRTMSTFDGYTYQMYEIVPDNVKVEPAGTVPFILCIHGLGSSKELILTQALTIAVNGYVVFVPDTRGQNSHTGPFSFGVDDVKDLQDLITWVKSSTHLPMVNKSAVGVFGHSMGALLALLLGAKDARVSCTVEASGPSNMSRVLDTEWFRLSLIGSPVDITNQTEIDIRTPLMQCNSTNPRNLMIIHGWNDTSVPIFHALDLNATVDPYGNRTDYRFLSYHSGHDLSDPSPLNASRTCFEAALANATLWYDEHLRHDTSRTYDQVLLFERDAIGTSMNDMYEAMYIALLVTTVFAFFTIVLTLQLVWQKATERTSKANKAAEKAAITPTPRAQLAAPRALTRQLAYIGVYIASFVIVGFVSLASPVSLVLKTIIFPILPLIPVAIIKARGERSSPWYGDLGMTGRQTIVSVGAAFASFGAYVGLYNLLTTKVYSRMTLVPYVFQGATGIALPVLFWYILPGIAALLLIDATYFQELYAQLVSLVRPAKLKAFLGNWFVKALLVAFLVGGIHTCGTVLFNIGLPDYDLRTIGSLQFMFKELLTILSLGIIAGFVLMALLTTKFTRNLPGAAVVLGLILSLIYVTVVPRIF
ncbi:MAG: alpha/beta fold hydrolase [Candidatus Lokiarchaeota archaeon]|nr:alpha/beta fold hydrolase [Candidatus Lokiarchaeota archaeon]